MTCLRFLAAVIGCNLIWLPSLFANGGAWQTGLPSTGDGAASDKKRSTDVAIEEENLTIDLQEEFAAVEVRYRMKNTGARVLQDFFFPLERWTAAEGEGEEEGSKPADLASLVTKRAQPVRIR
jgi:hypothetical protein